MDIDEKFEVTSIKELIYDHEDNLFYILANKCQEKLGFFILRINVAALFCPTASRFLIKVKNKFDIGDTGMFISRNKK